MLKNRSSVNKRFRLNEESDRLGNLATVNQACTKIMNGVTELCNFVEDDPAYKEYMEDITMFANYVMGMTGDVKKDLEDLTKKYYRYPNMRESMDLRYINEGKGDNGLRNSVLYGFLKNKVAPIIANTLVEKGFKAEPHVAKPTEKIQEAKVDVKKGGINGLTELLINYYNGEPHIAISNHKFVNAKDKKALAFISPLDNCLYVIPSLVLQANWRQLMYTDTSAITVLDAIGMRSEISICDVEKLRNLAAKNGYIYTLNQTDAAAYKVELEKYQTVDDSERKRNGK